MKRYLDPPLIAFVVVMVAAASITSHGTYSFFSYFLPSVLAVAATVVFAAGIPLLELAAVLDASGRLRYIAGMVFLLVLEGLAQYYQGQAVFVPNVQAQFPQAQGVDLATFAAQPEGRLLPVLYLAALSGVVVYFGYAASMRVKTLRDAPVTRHEAPRPTSDAPAIVQGEVIDAPEERHDAPQLPNSAPQSNEERLAWALELLATRQARSVKEAARVTGAVESTVRRHWHAMREA